MYYIYALSFFSDKSQLWKDGRIKYKFRDDKHSGGRYGTYSLNQLMS